MIRIALSVKEDANLRKEIKELVEGAINGLGRDQITEILVQATYKKIDNLSSQNIVDILKDNPELKLAELLITKIDKVNEEALDRIVERKFREARAKANSEIRATIRQEIDTIQAELSSAIITNLKQAINPNG